MNYKQIGIENFDSVYKNKLDLPYVNFILNDVCLIAGLVEDKAKVFIKKDMVLLNIIFPSLEFLMM